MIFFCQRLENSARPSRGGGGRRVQNRPLLDHLLELYAAREKEIEAAATAFMSNVLVGLDSFSLPWRPAFLTYCAPRVKTEVVFVSQKY